MLIARGLQKRYGDRIALDDFELTVAPGEIVGLVGHNGAGKSTFVAIVAGLLRPDAGTVSFDGEPPRRYRGRVGLAPQELALYTSATVRENLRLFAELAGVRGSRMRRAIVDTAGELDLAEVLDRRVAELSGGQQRRVQAGTALVHHPALLLLDEPTVGADPTTRRALLRAISRRAAAGATVCYTTHYLPELVELRASLAVADAGRVIARGAQSELLAELPGEVRVTYGDGTEQAIRTRDPAGTLAQIVAGAQPEPVCGVGEHPPTGTAGAQPEPVCGVGEHPPTGSAAGRALRGVQISEPSLDDLYDTLAVRHAHG